MPSIVNVQGEMSFVTIVPVFELNTISQEKVILDF